jgi:hypothetical protein
LHALAGEEDGSFRMFLRGWCRRRVLARLSSGCVD